MGVAKSNRTASWHSAPLVVSKRGSKAKFRLAIDLRPLNAATVKEAWPMPNLESEIHDFADSRVFATLDFISGYWQLPLHPDSYGACGIVTPTGVVSSTRVLPGLTNAASHFQSTVEPLFAELRANLKAWIDDFNVHGRDEGHLLSLLERFFAICQESNLFLSATKCVFFTQSVRWCGRIINADGYRMDPANVAGLRDMSLPRTAEELAQFVY